MRQFDGMNPEMITNYPKLIGIDCAVQAKKTGIAIGSLSDGAVKLESVQHGILDRARFIADVMKNSSPVLLAIDAPLGWPASMGKALADHRAAEQVLIDPNILFRRETDRFVKKTLGKQPLDVGADRIARTAWAAVDLLGQIRRLTGQRIPPAWNGSAVHESSCIEVYPAATLEAHGIPSRGYKGDSAEYREIRTKLYTELPNLHTVLNTTAKAIVSNDDAFDAVVCLVAAADFLQGIAMKPENMDVAQKEGWIWVRSRSGANET